MPHLPTGQIVYTRRDFDGILKLQRKWGLPAVKIEIDGHPGYPSAARFRRPSDFRAPQSPHRGTNSSTTIYIYIFLYVHIYIYICECKQKSAYNNKLSAAFEMNFLPSPSCHGRQCRYESEDNKNYTLYLSLSLLGCAPAPSCAGTHPFMYRAGASSELLPSRGMCCGSTERLLPPAIEKKAPGEMFARGEGEF